jgi:arginyl-tRNA synthetase
MIREEIKNIIEKSVKNFQKENVSPAFRIPEIRIEIPENKVNGDYSTNVAMVLAKVVKKNPMETAQSLESAITNQELGIFEKIEVVKPGFINFFLSKDYLQKQVGEILKVKDRYGNLEIGQKQKINVEFISANPTGPLTLGNGRGGFCGDVLANILEKTGYRVTREYYINDAGEQIKKLGHSILGDEEGVYKGDYILDLRKRLKEKICPSGVPLSGRKEDVMKLGKKAVDLILKEMIMPTVKKMSIKFDKWFYESELYKSGEVEKSLEFLKKKKLAYEKDGALWFKSTQFGDDKDRVLIKADGEKTYLASDVAYLKNKFKRGFKKLIYIWGADHFGYIGRIKAAAEALGYKKEDIEIIIMQLVKLFEKGKEVRMSKRTGVYVTLDELIDEVGLDVARFFFLTRSPDSHLNFDLDLAKEQSEKNPVYYVQYANARICSILRKLNSKFEIRNSKQIPNSKFKNFKLLNHPSELNLIKQLIRFPEIIEDTAKDYQVQRLPQYAVDLATSFHQFYRDCQVLSEDGELRKARLGLVLATKIVLKNTLDLMGISAPEKM